MGRRMDSLMDLERASILRSAAGLRLSTLLSVIGAMAACSGDMLLEALVACAGVTLGAVATALGITLRDASLQAEGDLDFRGTLGVSREAPVGFRDIRLHVTCDTDATDEQVATLLKLTERYCVVFQTLAKQPALTLAYERAGG